MLAQVDGLGDAYYYLNNQHCNVVHITNRLGGIVNSYEYDAFGHTFSATEGIPNRFSYAGEQFDPVTHNITCARGSTTRSLPGSPKRTSTAATA
ncbi:hypothetical protein [Paenibacillus dendritiformis]|uniref:hypothetical protein n=1 Tax=Paenibacillus dendritiformis TaxID=130049 RepID=UPI00198049EF|nr:hypothetical protein [Paenibacillus dendritiformis]